MVVILVKIKWLQLRNLSSDDCVCSYGGQDQYHVVFSLAVVGLREVSYVAPSGKVDVGFTESHHEIMEMAHNGVEF